MGQPCEFQVDACRLRDQVTGTAQAAGAAGAAPRLALLRVAAAGGPELALGGRMLAAARRLAVPAEVPRLSDLVAGAADDAADGAWRLAGCVARLGPGSQYGATLVRAGETWAVEEKASWYCGALQPTVELPPATTCVLYYWRSAG